MTTDSQRLPESASTWRMQRGFQRVRELASRGHGKVGAFALFALATGLWLLPVLADLDGRILGERANDTTSTARDYWVAEQSGRTPFTLREDRFIGAPEGRPSVSAIQIANAVQPAFVWALKSAIGTLPALNVFLLLGFLLTAFMTFVLLSQLGLGFLPSIFGGYVFGFSPWLFEQGFAGHVNLTHAWVLPLIVLALLRLRRRRTIANASLVGLALALAFYMQSYLGLLGSVAAVIFIAVDFGSRPTWSERLWSLTLFDVSCVFTFLALLPAVATALVQRDDVAGAFSTQSSDFFGAKPSAYVVPSARQPFAEQFLASDSWPPPYIGDAVVFFGYSTITLAIVGLILAIRRHPTLAMRPDRPFAVLFAAILLPLAFVISLPPQLSVGGLEFPTPSVLIGEITSAWRIYSRFGVLVGLALAILAAYALHALILRYGPRGQWLVAGFIAVAAFELAPGPPVPTWAANPVPAYVKWLANHPGGIIAQYPLREYGTAESVAHTKAALYYQTKHGHPIFATDEAFAFTREESIRLLAGSLHEARASLLLALEGVKYVLVHDKVYRALDQEPPTPSRRDYRLIAEVDDVRIFTLRNRPRTRTVDDILDAPASVARLATLRGLSIQLGREGFYTVEPSGWRWLNQGGVIEFTNASTAELFRVEFQAFTNRQPRTLELRSPDGTVLDSVQVLTSTTDVSFGPLTLPRGRFELVLHAIPGPEGFEVPDGRIVSVYVSPPSIKTVASNR